MRVSVPGVVVLLAFPIAVQAQAKPDTIRGTVAGPGGPVPGASIIVTRGPDRATFRGASDATGGFTVVVPEGTGDYLVYVAAEGVTPIRRRITANAGERIAPADIRLLAAKSQQLAAVAVKSTRPTPARGPDVELESLADRGVDGVPGGIAADQQGDLNAMAATLPGLIPVAGGVSFLGMSPSQNSVTLNGMAFPASDLPRDVRMNARIATSPFDPSRGWFSGASVDAQLPRAALFANKKAHVMLNAPAATTSSIPRGATLSWAADGPADLENRRFYNVAIQGSRQVTDAVSLLNADRATLQGLGIVADSVARFSQIANAAQLPLGAGIGRPLGVRQSGSVFARLERNGDLRIAGKPTLTTWGFNAYGRAADVSSLGLAPTATPSRASSTSDRSAALNGNFTRYLNGTDRLLEARATLAGSSARRRAGHALPGGQVAIRTGDDPAGGELANVLFGGGAGDSRTTRLTAEAAADLKLYPAPTHRVKISADVRLDEAAASATNYGQFTYASLEDLAAGTPSSFTRAIESGTSRAGVVNAFAAIGDMWTPTASLQVNYGVRLEAASYLDAPAAQRDIEDRFGARTNGGTSSFHASPRAGFTWRIAPGGDSYRADDLGSFRIKSPSYLRGGIGEFRNIVSPTAMLDVISGSRAVVMLQCVGSATPLPQWSDYAADASAIPEACADGATAAYSSDARAVHFLGAGYQPSRSWRGNLSYATQAGPLTVTLDGTLSRTMNLPGLVDRNQSQASSFFAAGENRAVYAPAASIVPSTGLISRSGTRADPAFGQVVEHVSDLRSTAGQYTVMIAPNFRTRNFTARAGYTLATSSIEYRGAEGTAFGSSNVTERARGAIPTHQFLGQFGVGGKGLSVTGIARVLSGRAYTPIVSQDVNGDGWVNDRAFIFDPAAAAEPMLSAGMQSLLARAPRSARACLERQLGTAASHNSCRGPWTAFLDATARLNRPGLRARRISSIDLSMTNVLAGVDALVNGDNTKGWGQSASPDPVLFTVAGFDPATRAYAYRANESFGRTRPSLSRLVSPFRLALDVTFNLGTPVPRQQFNSWVLPGRAGNPGKRLTLAEVRTRYARQVPDPYQLVLAESDSLMLSRTQVDSLKVLQVAYRARIDSVWTDLATYVAGLGDSFNSAEAFQRQEDTMDRGWELAWHAVQGMRGVLNPVQMQLLPLWAGMLQRAPAPVKGFRAAR